MNDGRLSDQLSFRIFAIIKSTLYRSYSPKSFHEYKSLARFVRNNSVVKKYLFCNRSITIKEIKRHPHFFLVNNRMYWLDYLFSAWIANKR